MCLAALTVQGFWSWGTLTLSCARERQTSAERTPVSGSSSVCTSRSPMAGSFLCKQHQTLSNAVSIHWGLLLLCLLQQWWSCPSAPGWRWREDPKVLRSANTGCCALLLLHHLPVCHHLSDLHLLLGCALFLETSFDGRWLFTVLRACEDSAGLQGLCKVYLLVWCCWVFLNSRSLLGAGSQCGCAYRGRYTFSLFVHECASCLPS